MPVEQRSLGVRPDARPAVSKPQFRLRLPDVSARPKSADAAPAAEESELRIPVRDPIAAARAKLSEKRFADGRRQITRMIEKLRGKRQRLIKILWAASVALTALSVIALAVEFVHKTNFLHSAGDTIQTDDQSEAPRKKSRGSPSEARCRKLPR